MEAGWLKSRLSAELESGACVLETVSDLEEFVSALTSCKNQWYSRGGFSPLQLIFGHGPRVPHELLTDDGPGELGLADLHADPLDGDTPAAEFSKRFQIRQKARERAIQHDARDRVARAGRAKRHEIKNWNVGQWVYVWRQAAPSVRSTTSQILLPRSRWVGPGTVVLQHGSTVWVQVRARLWKCDTRQLRPALREEILGVQLAQESDLRELLQSVSPGVRASAVDVAREGDPPAEAWEPTPIHEPETPPLLPPIPEQHPAIVSPEAQIPQVPVPVEPFARQVTRETDVPSRPHSTITHRSSDASETASDPKRQRLHDLAPGVQARAPSAASSSAATPSSQHAAFRHDDPLEQRMQSAAREMIDYVHASRRSGAEPSSEDQALFDAMFASNSAEIPVSETYIFENLDSGWCFVVGSGNEISLKDLNSEERLQFDKSDAAEWKAIVDTGAVLVLSPNESERVKKQMPQRIMTSRIVRRWKPQPGIGCKKAKSRWCVHGHQDHDAPQLKTFSPTPMTESLYLFLLMALGLGLSIDFADVKNAFCQSNPIQRAAGPVYAEACPGLGLPPGTLIQLVAPVYGLLDAPRAWRETVKDHLINQLGFEQNPFENCLFVRRRAGAVTSMILVEVDDLVIASDEECKAEIKDSLMKRFQFGRWVSNEEDYAGRRVRVRSDRIEVFQDKYILENLFPIKLPKARRGQRKEKLLDDEFEAARSLLYKISWVAKETRPEASGMCSILASRLHEGTVEDIHTMNKMVSHLRNTASRPLILWKFDIENMAFIVGSDAGGVGSLPQSCEGDGSPSDGTQGAWLVLAAERLPTGAERVRVSPVCWRSAKLKRRVPSTLAGEALALSQGMAQVVWMQVMLRSVLVGDVSGEWADQLSPYMIAMPSASPLCHRNPQVHVIDAKSVFDVIQKEGGSSSKQDRRTAIELAIVSEAMKRSQATIRWVPHFKMFVDALTKADISKGAGALLHLLGSGKLQLVVEHDELSERAQDPKRKLRSKAASDRQLLQETAQLMSIASEPLDMPIWQYARLGSPYSWFIPDLNLPTVPKCSGSSILYVTST